MSINPHSHINVIYLLLSRRPKLNLQLKTSNKGQTYLREKNRPHKAVSVLPLYGWFLSPFNRGAKCYHILEMLQEVFFSLNGEKTWLGPPKHFLIRGEISFTSQAKHTRYTDTTASTSDYICNHCEERHQMIFYMQQKWFCKNVVRPSRKPHGITSEHDRGEYL